MGKGETIETMLNQEENEAQLLTDVDNYLMVGWGAVGWVGTGYGNGLG
jgi:hypothetical protein